ncbi:unnamed protein product [Trichogramma brassicae]|uniref:Uncharacterized protein n=1 Tax=Trichogramma brassicae TaxID=86971 RepID=A0A6H5J3M0_9HYME|nr:unnamed protein product [Trichogramma brassicae]
MFRAQAARASSKSTRIQKKSTWISRKSVVIAFFSAHDRSTWNPCMTHVESLYDPRGIPVRSTRITYPRGFPRGYPCNYFQLGIYRAVSSRATSRILRAFSRTSSKSTRIEQKSTWICGKSAAIAFFSDHDRSTWNPCMIHLDSLYDPRNQNKI